MFTSHCTLQQVDGDGFSSLLSVGPLTVSDIEAKTSNGQFIHDMSFTVTQMSRLSASVSFDSLLSFFQLELMVCVSGLLCCHDVAATCAV